ncbi:MAG TPA: IS3 family transposase [Myxococcales bacterium LLY-WYZ-16_1]|nr:IS3 family transposase [Myxococcales bacterium LLY-WYZ-16_1]
MFELIHAERAQFPIAFSCRVLEVSRAGYYAWLQRGPSMRSQEDLRLLAEILSIHKEHKGRYGSPRIHQELVHRGFDVGQNRVARLMAENDIQGRQKRRFKATTDSKHKLRVAANVLGRNFVANAPNEKWVADITYIRTLDGWMYLAVLLDLFSRRVVGWAMSSTIDTDLALQALRNAVDRRRPPAQLVHHTDRDSRYCSHAYQAALEKHGLEPSMSRKGDCWDNAVAESFFATLEKELLEDRRLTSTARTMEDVSEYIEAYYNTIRRHSAIDYRSPIEFELRAAA